MMLPDEIERMRQDHRAVCGCLKWYRKETSGPCPDGACEDPVCYSCMEFASQQNLDWPCDAAKLLVERDRLDAQVEYAQHEIKHLQMLLDWERRLGSLCDGWGVF